MDGASRTRISIFLNVFDVHVNRSPISGVIRDVRYQKGKFLNAMNAASAEQNEQNVVTVEGEGQTVVFKQIAGLLARRIVFNKKVGDRVATGRARRLDQIWFARGCFAGPLSGDAVKVGDRVKGGSSVLLIVHVEQSTRGSIGGADSARSTVMDPELSEVPKRRKEDRPSRRLRKGMYILPSLFTTANIAVGILRHPAGHARHGDRAVAF